MPRRPRRADASHLGSPQPSLAGASCLALCELLAYPAMSRAIRGPPSVADPHSSTEQQLLILLSISCHILA